MHGDRVQWESLLPKNSPAAIFAFGQIAQEILQLWESVDVSLKNRHLRFFLREISMTTSRIVPW